MLLQTLLSELDRRKPSDLEAIAARANALIAEHVAKAESKAAHCIRCGAPLARLRRSRKYCGDTCRQRAHRARLRPRSFEIERIEWKEADSILERGHYLGAVEYTPVYCFATPKRDAVAVFSPPVASHFKRALAEPLELARLWRADDSDFATSRFLAACLRWLRKNTKAECVFSYADPAVTGKRNGKPHNGTVYQAANFAYLGTSRVTDRWQTPSGEIISSPVCYRRLKTKSRAEVAKRRPKWKLIPGAPKHLYLYALAESTDSLLPKIAGRYTSAIAYPQK
jgi:hypothetical protein